MHIKLLFIIAIGLFAQSYQVLCAQSVSNDTVWFAYPSIYSKNGGEACFFTTDANPEIYVENVIDKKKPVWKVQGEILYDYMYRSLTNNPLQEEDVYRHMVQVNYKIAGPVPLQGSLSYSTSNSVYYPDLFNATINYSRAALLKDLKDKYMTGFEQQLPVLTGLTAIADSMASLDNSIQQYQRSVQGADYQYHLQKGKEIIFNEALQMINNTLSKRDSMRFRNDLETVVLGGTPKVNRAYDSSGTEMKILNWVALALTKLKEERKELESLMDKRKSMASRFNSTQKIIKDTLQKMNKAFANSKDITNRQAAALMDKYLDTGRNKLVRFLSKFDRISIGRSEVNYSMLTVNAWPITGINVATATRPKIEFAAGLSNYRQRNFLIGERGTRVPSLPSMAFRFHFLSTPAYSFSYTSYAGSILLHSQNVSNLRKLPVYGNGLQFNLHPLLNHRLEVEFVKSNLNEQRALPATGLKTSGGLFNFGIRENEGIRLKYAGHFTGTKLKAEGEYSRLGSNFLSLGIYPGEAVRESYKANVHKLFFKDKIDLKLGVRKNSFTYPYLQQLTANNVLYQGLITLKIPKLPIVTVGYFPATQLVAMPDSNLAEVNFQTLIATATYQLVKPSFTHLFLLSGSKLRSGLPHSGSAMAAVNNNFLLIQYHAMRTKWNAETQLVYNNMNNKTLLTYGAGGGIKHGKGWHESAMIKYHVNNTLGNELGYRITVRSRPFSFGHFVLEAERQMLPYYMGESFIPVVAGHAMLVVKL
jgi:hypothetical protein